MVILQKFKQSSSALPLQATFETEAEKTYGPCESIIKAQTFHQKSAVNIQWEVK